MSKELAYNFDDFVLDDEFNEISQDELNQLQKELAIELEEFA